METNEKTPRDGGEQNGEKKPHHKHHRRRPRSQGEASGNPVEQNSPGDTINVRPGRYDVPPEQAERVEPIRIQSASAVESNAEGTQTEGEHKRHRSRHRRGRGGSRAAQAVENAAEITNESEASAPAPEAPVPEASAAPSEAPAEAAASEDGASAEGEHKHRRRSRGRRGRGRRDRSGEAAAAESESSVSEDESGTSEYITTAGSLDAEVVEELNSITDADAERLAEEEPVPETPEAELETFEIVGVRFKAGGKIYYFDPNGEKFKKDDPVIVETARGLEFGTCDLPNRTVTEREVVLPLRPVVRRATAEDIARHEANVLREKEAMVVCAAKIVDHKLQMKLIDVEYTFDNSKLLFYFTADGRVDFRELVKDLASVFRTRIELRQIGIRDETKLLGGIGICGRPFCCKTFLSDFVQVSIKMAKEQNLSLNSVKISGACGRLMCCLRYEYDTYQEEIRKTPKCDQIVATPDGDGTVVEVQPLAGLIRVRFSEPDKPMKMFHRDEVKVIGGKGVKPKDLPKEAPKEISAAPAAEAPVEE